MILSVEPVISMNTYSKCRIRETGVTVSRNNDSRINQKDRGHLSLGIVILTVEPGGLGSFVSRNNDYI